MTTPSQTPRKSVGLALAIGLGALIGGVWLFLNARGVNIPQFKDLWPILLIAASLASLVDLFVFSKAPRSAGWAVAWLGFGVLAFALTLDYTTFGRILDWLPSFPMILGLAFIATWLAGRKTSGNLLVAGVILAALGLMGYAARFDFLKKILPSAQIFWAILLVVCGLYLVWRVVSQARK